MMIMSSVRLLAAFALVGHYDCKLSQEEFARLVTWIDANAPYYGVYQGKKNLKWKGLHDFRPLPADGLEAPREPEVERRHGRLRIHWRAACTGSFDKTVKHLRSLETSHASKSPS